MLCVPGRCGLTVTMILQWQLTLAVECIFLCVSSKPFPQRRRCAFQVSPQNSIYTTAGSVNGSVQHCENTQCCVGYYVIINGRPKADVLACDKVEKSCPDATCKAQSSLNGRILKCACNTDLCNNNITWTTEPEDPAEPSYLYSEDDVVKTAGILVGAAVVLCFLLAAAKLFRVLKEKQASPSFVDGNSIPQLCSCQTAKHSEIDAADIELQEIVGHGNFASVWKGKYQGSVVAVKVFPAICKHKFTTEREVYELPLMKHDGIVHFLGTGLKPDDGSWLIVLRFAENGSLHSFLSENTISWMSSLKLGLSLSRGLAYLHSDVRKDDAHKPHVAHRDLSSSNVLVRADGTCALCDFESSTILRPAAEHHRSDTANTQAHAQVGMLRYMPPEILEGYVNLKNTWCLMQGDVYALALLLWEIWMRCSDLFEGGVVPKRLLPYESELGAHATKESLILHVCRLEERPPIPQHWKLLPQGSDMEGILTDSWDCEPDARLTAHCLADRLLSLRSCYLT